MEILNLFFEIIKAYFLEIIVVGALVEIIKKQWLIKFLYKNIKWWINRLLPLLVASIICLIWILDNFHYQEYLKSIGICWAFSSLAYNFLEKKLKGNKKDEEDNY